MFACLVYPISIYSSLVLANRICDELEQPRPTTQPTLRLTELKLYKLRKQSVVSVAALPFTIPGEIKRYQRKGEAVIRLTDLETVATIVI